MARSAPTQSVMAECDVHIGAGEAAWWGQESGYKKGIEHLRKNTEDMRVGFLTDGEENKRES